MTQFASCCKPVPGDPIAGFITQGRGVSIHHAECAELERLREREANRILSVDWDDGAEITYPVDIVIEAFDRSGLLRDVMVILANERVNVLGANTLTDKQSNQAHLELTLEIGRLDKLGKVMDKINQIPNVNDVHRKRTSVH
jgi:GTP pyrophosphokinase